MPIPVAPPPQVIAYEATDWETLTERLAEDVRTLRGGDPLKPVTLVVPSVGMKIWLTRRLAEKLGVAANIRAVYPRQLVGEIAAAAGVPPESFAAYSRERLVWRLRRALGDPDVVSGTPLENYLNDDDGVKRVRLALRLADTFDRYLAYRPETILAWDRAEATDSGDARWQSRLWRAATRGDGTSAPCHFPALLDKLAAPGAAAPRLEKLPHALFLVGIAGMPPAYLRLFRNLGEHLPMRVYQTIPSEDFLSDLPRNAAERAAYLAGDDDATWRHHPLLMTCGKSARMLRDRYLDEFPDSVTLAAPDAPADIALARLQMSLKNNDETAATGARDGSVTVDVCHGPMREVEVLRDRLLAALDELPGLRPRDILVLSPAIGDYAAYIDAVFGGVAPDDPLRIPYSVADKPAADGHPAYELASALLALPRSRMTAGEVAALLESPVTAARMRRNDGALNLVRARLEQSGVSWGADAAHRESVAPGALPFGTWRDFLARLRLGFALAPDPVRLFDDEVSPLPGIESGALATLGELAERVERLILWHAEAKRPRPVTAWCERFLAELDAWLPADDDTFAGEARTLREILARTEAAARAAGCDDDIRYAEFAECLRPEFAVTEDGGRFFTEGVTFAALKTLRTVPARVIVLLGANARNFPRKNRPDGFDLMAKNPRPGDPDKVAEDRGLFLECLLAARDRFAVVVTGRSATDDTPLPLSPVVEELLAALAPPGAAPEEGITRQPPFPHSSAYRESGDIFTYDTAAVSAGAARPETPEPPFALFADDTRPGTPEPGDDPLANALPESVEWRAFTGHFCDFARTLLRDRLGLDLAPGADERPEDEMPEEDDRALDRYRLTEALIGRDTPPDFRNAAAEGLASPSGPGAAQFEHALGRASAIRRKAADAGAPLPFAPAYPVAAGPLTLRFQGRFFTDDARRTFVTLRLGKYDARTQLRAELDALALALRPDRAPGDDGRLLVVYPEGDDAAKTNEHVLVAPEEAREKLARLAGDFIRHRDTPYPLSPAARLKLRELPDPLPESDAALEETIDGETLAKAVRDVYRENPEAEALWPDSLLAAIEDWDAGEIRRRAAYEHRIWSVPAGNGDAPRAVKSRKKA